MLDGYLYDFAKYGDSYGVRELETHKKSLEANIKTLAKRGYDTYDQQTDTDMALA
jgi:hypothetical protein